jgi:serine/threonine-protein phosphatase 2B regulatory subunit
VSIKEFRTLVLHPNPGVVDMHREISKEKDVEVMKEKQALAGKMQGLDLTTFQRQKEITVREQKKKMIVSFVVDNEVDFAYIKRCHLRFLELGPDKRLGGRIRFPEFCTVMDVEPIQEYKNLHAFYDTEEMGDMDIREFLLSMLNFVDVDKDARIRFSFEMYDELKTGYISQAEVEEILKGNHMLSVASVRRKADTIMKQANSTKKGSITMNEFVVVSKKFPNILLPAVGFVPQFKSNAVVA